MTDDFEPRQVAIKQMSIQHQQGLVSWDARNSNYAVVYDTSKYYSFISML
eukprot:UN09025